ncbi:retrovirus-related pol polyprotein from transposon TNT 1-94 [Tanacetum coccineum]
MWDNNPPPPKKVVSSAKSGYSALTARCSTSAEQLTWLADTDEEIDEQVLEAHYSYQAQNSGSSIAGIRHDAGHWNSTAEYSRTLGESNKYRDSCLVALQNKQTELVWYKVCMIVQLDYDKLEQNTRISQTEYFKRGLITKGLVKEKTKVITDLKLREEKDIDKMISMDHQINFLNEIVYKRNQSIQTIQMLAPKCSTFNGRPTFANPMYHKKAQSDPATRLIPDSEEILTLADESRSKLNKDLVKPFDYTKLNSLYEIFKPPTQHYEIQFAQANEIRKKMWRKSFVKTKPNVFKNIDFLPVSKSVSKSRQAYNVMTNNINHLSELVNQAWVKHSNDHLYLRHPTAQDMEILVKKCLMPLALKTQNDSLAFIHELKQEMHADLKYVESLEDELDELESDKAEFSNMYDMLLQECVSKDVMCSYLLTSSDLDEITELQCLYLHKVMECDCLAQKLSEQTDFVSKEIYTELLQRFARLEKHSISLEIALQECQVQLKNDTVCKERASNVFRKEREQYVEIQDLKAQLQDKNMAISELKKLVAKCKGKSVDTKFDKPSVVRQPNAQRIPKPSVLGKPAPFSGKCHKKENVEKIISWVKHSNDHLYLRHPTAQDMEILVKKCLMPLALKTQNDSLAFIHELKKEMHADLKYVESLEDELDELESDKAEFSNMYDMLLQECVSKDVMCSYLLTSSDLDEITELQCLYLHKVRECDCLAQKLSEQTKFVSKEIYTELLRSFAKLEKHSISLKIALQECQEQLKNDTDCKEKASNVFRKEREQCFEIQDLKAQLQDKNIAIRKSAPFSDSLERTNFAKKKSVSKTNESEGLSKPDTPQNFPQTAKQAVRNTNVIKIGMYRIACSTTQSRAPQLNQTSRNTNPRVSTSTGVAHKTNVSIPQSRSNQMKDKVVPNTSHVKFKKTEVEEHPRISSISNQTKFVTACNDSLNSRTSNVNVVCATCGKCMFNLNHDACVSKYLNDVNARTNKPNGVPTSTRKPKSQANKSIATPHKIKQLHQNPLSQIQRVTIGCCIRRLIVQLILFIVDSGCTKHMTGNLSLLCNFVEKYLGTVRFGNDQFAPILGYGDLVQGNITIKRVYYVEGLNHNLFSVGQFCDADLEVAFRKSTCFVRDLQGNDLLTGNRGTDLYTISLQETTSSTPICLMAKASPTQAWLWHRRLSHLNFDYINLLSKKDVVIGLPKLKYVKDQLCSSCEVSKAKRSSFKSKTVPSSKGRLNLLHMDLCGPMRVASINGKKYILVIVDDYSRYTWTLFLRSKDETPEVLKDFLTMIQRNLQAPVISVRTDMATEFLKQYTYCIL